jgi:hypothetical protein
MKIDYVGVVSMKTQKINVIVNEKQCKFQSDTGATVNLIDQKTHD